ncbi:MAG: T9SS type A sorting domain-containing protein [Bacteroidales bacterium]|nr:T9SS type A sorting domain-containing protein [Bacteroidales bacterium]MCF8456490.1 T9SS type A sorting domain-containing protein [Bacteroidales bacterium]
MKKIYILLISIIFATISTYSQTTIYSFDFENYTAGIGIASQAGTPWTTWSGTTGGSEDPVVSTDFAASGINSVKCVTNNDLVLDLADLTTGRYQITFDIFVKTGKVAYLNLLQDFAASNSEWATQTYFNVNGTGTVDANGESTGTFTFTHETWVNINYIIDLDDDFATLYIDGVEIVSWKWSLGSFGSGTMVKLDAVNFYGWTDDLGNGSQFYIDDVSVIQQLSLDGPSNLAAVVTANDIALDWTAPVTTPDSYILSRNGSIVATGIATLTYSQPDMYPNTYDYVVRGHYSGLGYSSSSNTATAVVTGGVDRDLVLFEISTGTWCGYCPGAAMGADDLEAASYNVAIIEYHNGDPYATTDCGIRENYYSINSWPTTVVDGIAGFSGGNATTSLFPDYEYLYNDRKDVPSVHLVDLQVTYIDSTNYVASITVEQSNPYFSDGLVLRAALTESHIPEVWGGLTEVNFVCLQMYPDAYGTPINFASSTTYSTTINFALGNAVTENCEFIVFLQHDPSKEVIQTARFHFSTVGIGKALAENYINVYPNPSHGEFNLDITTPKTKSFDISIMNLAGQVVEQFQIEQVNIISKNIDLSKYDSGFYFIRIGDGTDTVMKKIQVIK